LKIEQIVQLAVADKKDLVVRRQRFLVEELRQPVILAGEPGSAIEVPFCLNRLDPKGGKASGPRFIPSLGGCIT
jgi:hypothetical protein